MTTELKFSLFRGHFLVSAQKQFAKSNDYYIPYIALARQTLRCKFLRCPNHNGCRLISEELVRAVAEAAADRKSTMKDTGRTHIPSTRWWVTRNANCPPKEIFRISTQFWWKFPDFPGFLRLNFSEWHAQVKYRHYDSYMMNAQLSIFGMHVKKIKSGKLSFSILTDQTKFFPDSVRTLNIEHRSNRAINLRKAHEWSRTAVNNHNIWSHSNKTNTVCSKHERFSLKISHKYLFASLFFATFPVWKANARTDI